MADDLLSRLRPATPEEWGPFRAAMSGAFGETPAEPFLTTPPPVAELDRSLALFEDGRVAATAGIYSLQMTVPGGILGEGVAHGPRELRPLLGGDGAQLLGQIGHGTCLPGRSDRTPPSS